MGILMSAIEYSVRMGVLEAFTILMAIASIAIIVVVMMQSGTNDNVGVITGASDTFYGRNKDKNKEGVLKKVTIGLFIFIMICAIIAFVVGVVD
ncbi:MAG: preprotein translocase subunit SecG [Clostridia bacterium]|nr:preprotein translocase subunit SecG [Clostridia bacterium]